MEMVSVLRAAGDTDPGLQREVNEDRFHFDLARRLFMVVDGVGGQAAGGKAADTAIAMLRSRLERETGPTVERVREAITVANNEIHRVASLRPEWNGMACVLTVVLVEDGRAIVGHVGDTRLYKVHHGRMEKVTRDHSPVGEREDAHELSELEAMHHPRRNEVYRDVGSDPHEPGDPDFVDVREIPFEPDAALLLCSDGLTDLVDSDAIRQIVARWAGQPHQVVRALIGAANDAGGKDNVTVVYVEGEQFALTAGEPSPTEITRRLSTPPVAEPARLGSEDVPSKGEHRPTERRQQSMRVALLALLTVVIVLAAGRSGPATRLAAPSELASESPDDRRVVVRPTQSIGAALLGALPGTTVVVEPGEYRETLTLKSDVRLVSSVPHGAVIRLPGAASDRDAAVVARDVTGAAFEGFRVMGDAATPLGTGITVESSELAISGIEVTGAATAAIAVDPTSQVRLIGSDVHDNPGAALLLQPGSNATISHNVFIRNGSAGGPRSSWNLQADSGTTFVANVFVGIGPDMLASSSDARAALVRDNWFVGGRGQHVTHPRPASR
ncbi:MAG: family protein phosphatase [Acidobacteriota bacterium]|jgi:serine/threonine protein phosphatase PrpC